MPRQSYLQRLLYSTCPDHHISNPYCILHALTIISPMHTAFYIPNHHNPNLYYVLQAPFISTRFSTLCNVSHFTPSSLSSYFLLLRYKHSCQQLFSNFSLCAIPSSQNTICQNCVSPYCKPVFCQHSDRQNLAT